MDVMDNLQRDRETIQRMRGRVRVGGCVGEGVGEGLTGEGCGRKKNGS